MKKINLFLSFVLLVGINLLQAQKKGSSEIKVGYGISTSNEDIDIFSSLFENIITDDISYEDLSSSGAINFSYRYAIANNLTLGGAFVYEKSKEDVKHKDILIGERKYNYYTVAIESDYGYISKGLFRIYSGLGLGYTFGNKKFDASSNIPSSLSIPSDENDSNINFHVNALGVRVGKSLAGFVELGYGYKGIVNIGISYRF